ncbi:uncharacterized protein LOC132043534 [Lycium ferocissimum]|uniref:uncharacterized protein LOC132043534 n=1 Tax=Lycium ferocissimum TaxID=112874 RepID=UPI002814B675|nr:uncharacterized protein LOC132043534 [Lycium ferocissimum]
MVGLIESWCFCNGGGKTEKMKGTIFTGKGSAMAHIGENGTGFLIHRNLLITTHVILPSVNAAEGAEIRLQNGVVACLFPHRFFITSTILDLTIVGLDVMDGDTNAHVQQPHYLKTCSKPNLELGNVVYLLGYSEKKELTVGEGKVVIATDNLIKLSTDGITWRPGSAGFDVNGNLAFMVCDPMKLAKSPNSKSSSTSPSPLSSRNQGIPMQFGIPIPIICDWLNQHWEGSLDDLNKPKLPLIRLMSAGQKSDHSCASFTMRRVFKSTEAENDGTPSSSNRLSRPREDLGPSRSATNTNLEEEAVTTDPHAITHVQGIPTPEIFESRRLTSIQVRKKESTQIQLLDINFPPKIIKADDNCINKAREEKSSDIGQPSPVPDAEVSSTGSVNGAHQSEVESSCSLIDVLEAQNEYSSDGETTMYSAETAESRNYPSPKGGRFQQVGRSQSCVNYNRWGPVSKNSAARIRVMQEQKRGVMQGRKVYSQGANSHRSNSSNYYSPTVSSIVKKRNNLEPQTRPPRLSTGNSSPRWNF